MLHIKIVKWVTYKGPHHKENNFSYSFNFVSIWDDEC